ncbi:uncharacterized protein LOC111028395, partial [Myzus persicae]|uniref:uncharacterized protein LOC111028395 n=1 Tax=Myzus persicae TaxID=13164 RepID=UPI000B935F3E
FKITVEQLNVTLNEVQCKSKNLTNESVADLFESNNLNTSQKTIIQEIINASKVMNTKNRRYSENWILLCILLKIRSSTTYRFLREQEVLPLPCPRTIRKYLSMINIQCGFDKKFFQILKKKLVYLDSNKNMVYFGREVDSSELKANHALVFMFQSLALNFAQPIAVFASHGPVKGIKIEIL